MTIKKNIKILTQLLNIDGVKVISHRQYKGVGVILQIESIKMESVCPRCGTRSYRLHQNQCPFGTRFANDI